MWIGLWPAPPPSAEWRATMPWDGNLWLFSGRWHANPGRTKTFRASDSQTFEDYLKVFPALSANYDTILQARNWLTFVHMLPLQPE